MPPPDTLFTEPPAWHWLVVFYFFFGGLSAGSFFLGAMLDLYGAAFDRPMARLAYYTAFVMILPAAPLLILDLNRPERFWHMLIQSERPPLPMFKWWSPMSVGSWALLIFGAIALLMALASLAEEGRLSWSPLRVLRHGVLKILVVFVGALVAFFIASYTGVLLAVTNRPIWADTYLIGLLFLISAASTAAALLLLLAWARKRVAPPSVAWLKQMDSWALLIELVVLAAVAISLGALFEIWMSSWGLLLLIGVVLLGILIPLLLHWRPNLLGNWSLPAAAVLVLVGGFILRAVIVLSSESVEEVTTWLLR